VKGDTNLYIIVQPYTSVWRSLFDSRESNWGTILLFKKNSRM